MFKKQPISSDTKYWERFLSQQCNIPSNILNIIINQMPKDVLLAQLGLYMYHVSSMFKQFVNDNSGSFVEFRDKNKQIQRVLAFNFVGEAYQEIDFVVNEEYTQWLKNITSSRSLIDLDELLAKSPHHVYVLFSTNDAGTKICTVQTFSEKIVNDCTRYLGVFYNYSLKPDLFKNVLCTKRLLHF